MWTRADCSQDTEEATPPPSPRPPSAPLRERLVAFYAKHNPSKLGSELNRIVSYYTARLPQLNAALRLEYGGLDLDSLEPAAPRRTSPPTKCSARLALKRKRASELEPADAATEDAAAAAEEEELPAAAALSSAAADAAAAAEEAEEAEAEEEEEEEEEEELPESPSIMGSETDDDLSCVVVHAGRRLRTRGAHVAAIVESSAAAVVVDIVVVVAPYLRLLDAVGGGAERGYYTPSHAERAQSHFTIAAKSLDALLRFSDAGRAALAPHCSSGIDRRLVADCALTSRRWAWALGMLSALKAGDLIEVEVEVEGSAARHVARVLGVLHHELGTAWRCIIAQWGAFRPCATTEGEFAAECGGALRFVPFPPTEQRDNVISPWHLLRRLRSVPAPLLLPLTASPPCAAMRAGALRLLREPALALLPQLPFAFGFARGALFEGTSAGVEAATLPPRALLEHARAGGYADLGWSALERDMRATLGAFTQCFCPEDIQFWAARSMGCALRTVADALAAAAAR